MQAKIPKVNSILGPVPYRGYVKNHDTLYTHDVNGPGTEGYRVDHSLVCARGNEASLPSASVDCALHLTLPLVLVTYRSGCDDFRHPAVRLGALVPVRS